MDCCERNSKLISYKWDENDNVIEVYRCEECGKLIELFVEAEDANLENRMFDEDFYNKYNL
jgi:ABC-type ATPase with predicted acetyltransferase domain